MIVNAWVVIEGRQKQYGPPHTSGPYQGQMPIGSAKVVKVAQNKPAVAENQITMKIELDLDEGWFLNGVATLKASVPAPKPESDPVVTVDVPVRGRPRSSAASVIKP